MVFSACKPNFAAKKQALKQKIAGAGAYHGVSLRLLLVDKQVDAEDVLPNAALASVHVVKYDAKATTLAELVGLIREAHRQNGAPFLSMAIAQHGADAEGHWEWTTDLSVNLKNMHGAIDQLAPVIEVLAAALSKTKAGKAHIDLLACGLATTCKGLIPALEKMYGIDFRASTDDTGNAINGGDWKMETDNDYDVAADYLDAPKLKDYTEKMGLLDNVRRSVIGAVRGAVRSPLHAWCQIAVTFDDFNGAREAFPTEGDLPYGEDPEDVIQGIISRLSEARQEAFCNHVGGIPGARGWGAPVCKRRDACPCGGGKQADKCHYKKYPKGANRKKCKIGVCDRTMPWP